VLAEVRGYGCVLEDWHDCDDSRLTDLCRETKCKFDEEEGWYCPEDFQRTEWAEGWWLSYGIPDNDRGKEMHGTATTIYCYEEIDCAGAGDQCDYARRKKAWYCRIAGPSTFTGAQTNRRAAGRNCPLPGS
jgi:hypothetical protein